MFSIGVWRQAVWREVVPLVVAAVFAAQFGTLILQYADPVWLRWLMVGVVLVVVVVLGSGWRYHGRPLLIVTILVGLAAGALGGATQITGPPVVLFWLSSMASAATARANFIVFFAMLRGRAGRDLSGDRPVHAGSDRARGPDRARCISRRCGAARSSSILASETTYRRVAYVIITLAALVSMPLWDGWLR